MSSWRVVLTDTETLSGVAPVCPDQRKRGSAHDLIPQAVDDTRWDEESVYDCCPGPHIECWYERSAATLARMLSETEAEICPP